VANGLVKIRDGKASDLYRLLRWTSPEMRRMRLTEKEFVQNYGYAESVEIVDEKRSYGRRIRRSEFRERPGVSPAVYHSCSPAPLSAHCATWLQPYPPKPNSGRKSPRRRLAWIICSPRATAGIFTMSRARGRYRPGCERPWATTTSPPSLPDRGEKNTFTISCHGTRTDRSKNIKWCSPCPSCRKSPPCQKKQGLLDLLRQEANQGRKAVILVEQTTARPLPLRLEKILRQSGLRAMYLNPDGLPVLYANTRPAWGWADRGV
jgi:hypothetical protein